MVDQEAAHAGELVVLPRHHLDGELLVGEVGAGELLLVLLGNVQVDHAGTSIAVRAPAFFDTQQAMGVTAYGAARIVRIAR